MLKYCSFSHFYKKLQLSPRVAAATNLKAKLVDGNAAECTLDSVGNGKGKIKLLSRQSLDGRTRARKQFDAIAAGIAVLGGEADATTSIHGGLCVRCCLIFLARSTTSR